MPPKSIAGLTFEHYRGLINQWLSRVKVKMRFIEPGDF